MVAVGRSEKSPSISASVGSVWREGFVRRRILFHSCPAKKKNLPFLIGPKAMGPPRLHPKSLKRKEGFTGAKYSFASKRSLRTVSKRLPWNLSPPLLVTTLIDPPEFLPYCAENAEVCTFTSW